MKELKIIQEYFEKKKNTITKLEGDSLIVECKIQKDKFHSVMLILKPDFLQKIELRVEYNSFLLDNVPVLLENISVKNLKELRIILKSSTKMHLCKL